MTLPTLAYLVAGAIATGALSGLTIHIHQWRTARRYRVTVRRHKEI